MARLGFYGGVFNPPTKAHIELAKKALKECNLDKVVFVPVSDLYKKEGMAKGIDRFNMLKIACENEEKLEVSDIEINSKQEYKAIDIFEILKNIHMQDENFFLMGADNFSRILDWKDSNRLINEFNYIIIDRGQDKAKEIIENNEQLKKNKDRFIIVNNSEFYNCSSTDIREQIQQGKKPKNIDEKVYDYIRKNNIY